MNIAVIGRGLAAMGVLEALLHSNEVELGETRIKWVGPSIDDIGWSNCSRNSTAVVALHGIEKGVSPLGDDLVDAFYQTQKFIQTHRPDGVKKVMRYHLCEGAGFSSHDKLKNRFGETESFELFDKSFLGVREEAFVFSPMTFLKWWEKRILSFSQVESVSDFVTHIDSQRRRYQTLKGEFFFDKLFDCRGSGYADFEKGVKKTPGHYYVWSLENEENLSSESLVLTVNGHNLIIDAEREELVLGGSTEKSGLSAPATFELGEQIASFVSLIPILENYLVPQKAKLFTGHRPKAPKRQPLLKKVTEDYTVINGFYKNGYSLCHLLGERAII